jgi:hypothetical protein
MDWKKIVKQHGVVAIAKLIAADGKSYGLDEHAFTALITSEAQKRYSDMRPDAAFAKLYTGPDGIELRKAMPIIVASPFDVRTFSQDETENHPGTETNEAIESLKRIGQQRWPDESEAKQFANAFAANPELAAKAHRRPTGHPSFTGYPPASERERVRLGGGVVAWPLAASAERARPDNVACMGSALLVGLIAVQRNLGLGPSTPNRRVTWQATSHDENS